jgi:hypothetical protein
MFAKYVLYFKVKPLSEPLSNIRTLLLGPDSSPYILQDLTPGASYQVQLFTVFENKESLAYTSRNFTTSKGFTLLTINFNFLLN